MDGDGQHPVVVVENVLHPVAVVGVHVHVGHAHSPLQEVLDGNGGVVEDAEPVGMGWRGMVQAAGNGEGHVHPLCRHQFGGHQGSAGTQGGRVVHAGIDGVVTQGAEAKPLRRHGGQAGAQVPNGGDVLGGVDPLQFLLSGGTGIDEPGRVAIECAVG